MGSGCFTLKFGDVEPRSWDELHRVWPRARATLDLSSPCDGLVRGAELSVRFEDAGGGRRGTSNVCGRRTARIAPC